MQKARIESAYPDFIHRRFIFEFDCEDAAHDYFGCTPKDALATLKRWNFIEAVARFEGKEIPMSLELLETMASFEPLQVKSATQLFFADGSLPATIIKTAIEAGETDDRWGIVKLTKESGYRQVVMSSGMQGVLLAGVNIAETTNWRRTESWNPELLGRFNRDWQRQLDTEGERQIEYRYQIRKPGTTDPYSWYRSRFRLLQGEDGLLYHFCTFVDRE